MPLVIPTNYVSGSIPIKYGGDKPYGWVTCGLWDAEGDQDPVETLDIWVDAFLDNIAPIIDAGCNIGPGVGTVEIGGGAYGTFTGSATGAGGRADDISTSPQVAVIINKQTARIGRAGRGRMFLPWALDREDLGETGAIDTAQFDDLQDRFQAMNDQMVGLGVAPVLLHNTGVPGGTTPTVIIGWNVQPTVGTQRRRMRR